MNSPQTEESYCSECKRPLKVRYAAPQPTLLNFTFAASFIAFLVATHYRWVFGVSLWIWSGAQLLLGILLVRARLKAKHLVFRCTWCESNLRS